MFCKYCGSKLIDNAAFCHECGKATYEQPAYAPPAPQTPPVPPVYQQPAPPVQPVYAPPAPPQPVYQQPASQPVLTVYSQPVPQQAPPTYPQAVPPQYTYTVPANPVQPAPQAAVNTPDLAKLEKQILSCGIWGLCLSMLGVPGIILSTIANKKANAYKKLTGNLSDKARAGYRMCKAGKAVGIVMTVIWAIVLSTLEGDVTYDFNNPFEHYDF